MSSLCYYCKYYQVLRIDKKCWATVCVKDYEAKTVVQSCSNFEERSVEDDD